MSIIACCSFPTTLLVLDDDQEMLENIRYVLFNKYKYKCIGGSDLNEAQDILNKNRGWTKSLLKQGISQLYTDENPASFSVSVDVPLLNQQIYNPDRFKHIAIVILDYDMPKKTGLEFIQELNDPHSDSR